MMTDANRSQDVNLGSIDLDYWRGAYRGPPARRSGGGRPSAPGYFDDLVGAHEHKVGHGQAERLNGSETLTNTIGIVARLPHEARRRLVSALRGSRARTASSTVDGAV